MSLKILSINVRGLGTPAKCNKSVCTRAVSHKNTPYVNDSLIVKTPSIYANNEKKNTKTCHASSTSLFIYYTGQCEKRPVLKKKLYILKQNDVPLCQKST